MKNSAPLRVLQVVDTLGMGGAETWLMEVLRLWAKDGVAQVDFIATSGIAGVFDAEARKLGAQIHYLRYSRADLPRFAERFRRVLRQGNYHAIHDHEDYSSGWHFLMGSGLLPPVRITHVHNAAYQIRHNYGVTLGRQLTAWIGKCLVRRYATHIAGTSREVISAYGLDAAEFGQITNRVVHCGIDTARFEGDQSAARAGLCGEFGWPGDAHVILAIGRIDQSPDYGHPLNNKNSGLAVSIGIECARNDPRVRMILAGEESPAVPVLEARIAAAGLRGKVVFAGIRYDVAKLMLGSDVLLFPSRGEGLGMAAVEAQSVGLPVVASAEVPRDCEVIRGLVRFVELTPDPGRWTQEVLGAIAAGRAERSHCLARVRASAFSIQNSARVLYRLYGAGRNRAPLDAAGA